VDDNAAQRRVVAKHLQAAGYRVTGCDSGPEALLLLQAAAQENDAFDIALVDSDMPVMSGIDFGKAVRADVTLNATRTILLSPINIRATSADLAAAGFSAAYSKPLKMSELFTSLPRVLECDAPPLQMSTTPCVNFDNDARLAEEKSSAIYTGDVLVVDDNAVNQKVAQRFLLRFGCNVTLASDGAEAVKLCAQRSFGLILMDLQMPVMDGREATQRIREAQAGSQRIPIIALTGSTDTAQIESARTAGMDDYLIKPIELDQLQRVLDRFLPKAMPQRAARPS
jgi:CheY-like chemotaxis protein